MPLDYDELEKLNEYLNAAFDARIKDRVEECVQRNLPMVDQMIAGHIENHMRSSTSWVSPDKGGELSKWIEQQAKSAADHYIRLFGGAPALREIVGKWWDAGAEKYISEEVDRRLREAVKKLGLPT